MKSLVVAGLATALVAPAAFAGHGHYYPGYPDYPGYRYQNDRAGVEYARVVSTRPIYRPVEVTEPRRECWDERVVYGGQRYDGNRTAGTVLGAIAGGIGGHQFGQGHGRDAATVLGVLIGASIGNQIAREHSYAEPERVGYEQRCRTVPERHLEQRVQGYDVTYRHHGRLYTTRTPYDPGSRIAVQVDVRPVSY